MKIEDAIKQLYSGEMAKDPWVLGKTTGLDERALEDTETDEFVRTLARQSRLHGEAILMLARAFDRLNQDAEN